MNNNILTWRNAKQFGISFSSIKSLLKQNQLTRISRGVYGLTRGNVIADDMFILQNKSTRCIFSFYTAAYLHNVGDYIPEKLHVTIPHGYKMLCKNNNVCVHTISKSNIYNLGVDTIKNNFGNKVKVYNIEKTICDLIKYQTKLDINVNNKIFREYFNSHSVNYEKLYEYAKIMKIQDKIFTIKELLNE